MSQYILVRDNQEVVLLDGAHRVASCTSKQWDALCAFGLARFRITVTAIPQILSDDEGKKLTVILWGLDGRHPDAVARSLTRWVCLDDQDLFWLHRMGSTHSSSVVRKFLNSFRKFRKFRKFRQPNIG